jgi:hypothetical protein
MAIIGSVRWALYIINRVDAHGYLSWCQAAASSANTCKVTIDNNAELVGAG